MYFWRLYKYWKSWVQTDSLEWETFLSVAPLGQAFASGSDSFCEPSWVQSPTFKEGHPLAHVEDVCIWDRSGTACWPRRAVHWKGSSSPWNFPILLAILFVEITLLPFPGHRFQKSIYSSCNPYYKNGFILPVILIVQLKVLEFHSSPWTFSCLFLAVLMNSSSKWVAHRSSLSRLKFHIAYSLCCTRILFWQNFNHIISNLSHTDSFFFFPNSSYVWDYVNFFWILHLGHLSDYEKDYKRNVRCLGSPDDMTSHYLSILVRCNIAFSPSLTLPECIDVHQTWLDWATQQWL